MKLKKKKKGRGVLYYYVYQFLSLYSGNVEELFVLIVCAVLGSLLEQASLHLC